MDSLCFPWSKFPTSVPISLLGRQNLRLDHTAERSRRTGAGGSFPPEHLKLLPPRVCVWSPAALVSRGHGVKPGYRNVYVRHFC